MKLKLAAVLLILFFTTGCFNSGDRIRKGSLKPAPTALHAESISLQEFQDNIVGKTLTRRTLLGERNPEQQITFHENGTATGFDPNGAINLTWTWKSGALCRSGTVGSPDNTAALPVGCQSITFRDTVVSFHRFRGHARDASYFFD